MMHRPQPEFVAPVRFFHAILGRSIAAVTGSAAEFFGIVDLQQLLIGMTDESLLPAHGSLGEIHRLARAEMTGFAAVHQIDILDVNLADGDGEVIHLLHQPGKGFGADIDNAVGKILVALSAQLGGGFKNLDAVLQ